MAFPTVESLTATDFESASTVNHYVDMPASVNAGNLLLIVIATENATSHATPSGWTAEESGQFTGGHMLSLFSKVADGTEGGTTVNVVSNAGGSNGGAIAIRISGWYGTLDGLEFNGTTTGSATATPNPPSLTAGWGSDDNLWLAVFGAADDEATVSSYVSGYSGGTYGHGGTTNNAAETGACWKQAAAATEDPGTFTLSENEYWRALTIVIRPAAGGVTGLSMPIAYHYRRRRDQR